jgi:dihydroorotate dehydrogenase
LSCCKPAHALLLLLQWEELIERCQEAGVDAFEINFSCPHGMPERRMGMAMGQV